jgi:hypothetical protein
LTERRETLEPGAQPRGFRGAFGAVVVGEEFAAIRVDRGGGRLQGRRSIVRRHMQHGDELQSPPQNGGWQQMRPLSEQQPLGHGSPQLGPVVVWMSAPHACAGV